MKPQFTTPCYVRIDDAQQRKEVCEKLGKYGYDVFKAINHPVEDMIFTNLFFADGSYTNEPAYAIWKNSMVVSELRSTHIDCGTNEALFLELAAMRSDTYANQLMMCESRYTDPKLDYSIVEPGTIIRFGDFDEYAKAFYHRATAQEIIQWHKQKGETK